MGAGLAAEVGEAAVEEDVPGVARAVHEVGRRPVARRLHAGKRITLCPLGILNRIAQGRIIKSEEASSAKVFPGSAGILPAVDWRRYPEAPSAIGERQTLPIQTNRTRLSTCSYPASGLFCVE